jgi:hypothetical protein
VPLRFGPLLNLLRIDPERETSPDKEPGTRTFRRIFQLSRKRFASCLTLIEPCNPHNAATSLWPSTQQFDTVTSLHFQNQSWGHPTPTGPRIPQGSAWPAWEPAKKSHFEGLDPNLAIEMAQWPATLHPLPTAHSPTLRLSPPLPLRALTFSFPCSLTAFRHSFSAFPTYRVTCDSGARF